MTTLLQIQKSQLSRLKKFHYLRFKLKGKKYINK